MKERSCDGCAKCCEGWLQGEAHGHKFYRGRPCFFLNKTCSIYETRPENPCRSYKCGWLDEMQFPEWMKPDLVNVIINRAENNGIKYYVLIEAGSLLDVKVLNWMIQLALNYNKNLMYYIDGGMNRIGSKEFLEMPV
jgi:uncharacterized cysteine cluster protein YcgN (CxxCxxCC family)